MEYEVQATVILTCEISVEAENEEAAKEEADNYFDNGANYESDFFDIKAINDIEIETINEVA